MIREDYRAYNLTIFGLLKGLFTCHCFYAVLLYRIGNYLYLRGVPFVPDVLKALQLIWFSCEISPYAKIGGGLRIYHSTGIVIGHDCIIGKRVEVFQNVTLGGNDKIKDGRTMPTIGDNVSIFSGSCVLGPVHVGDNVSIGANSVLTKDIESNVVVAGVPAKILRKIDIARSIKNS